MLLYSPERASAGVVGCCINNSGNCAGGCGVEASDCSTLQLGSCPNIVSESECDGTQGLVRCFVPGKS